MLRQEPYRVFVIDDSRTIRRLIAAIVEETDGLVLAGSAGSAEEAWDVLRQPDCPVDVVSLDVELPGMNGLDFLKKLMATRPLPVLVVSGHTPAAGDLAITALENGAVDVIQKPDAHPREIDRFIADTASGLLRAAQSNHRIRVSSAAALPAARGSLVRPVARAADPHALICIGASTGGVPAVCKVVQGLRATAAPIVVAQHMPPSFTARLAARLAATTGLPAHEARDGQRLAGGTVWVAPGGYQMRIVAKPGGYVASLADEGPVSGHKPSIDVLFHAAARQAGAQACGVLLTGMGRDGADGLLAMRQAGARTIAQDEATSVVYGMPKVAAQIGAADLVMPLDRIADAVLAPPARPRTQRIASGAHHG